MWAKDFPRRSLRVPIFVPLVDYSKDSWAARGLEVLGHYQEAP